MTVPVPRFVVEFRWHTHRGWSGWETANAPLAATLDEVFDLIQAHSEYDNSMVFHTHAGPEGTVRVTEIGTGANVTTEALMHYAALWLAKTGDVAQWVEEALAEAA